MEWDPFAPEIVPKDFAEVVPLAFARLPAAGLAPAFKREEKPRAIGREATARFLDDDLARGWPAPGPVPWYRELPSPQDSTHIWLGRAGVPRPLRVRLPLEHIHNKLKAPPSGQVQAPFRFLVVDGVVKLGSSDAQTVLDRTRIGWYAAIAEARETKDSGYDTYGGPKR